MDYNAGLSLTESVTACKTALATLKRLGQSDQADGPLTQAASSTSYSAIDADTTHNDQWKLQKYAGAYINVMSTLAGQLTTTANTASTSYKLDAETVFGTRGLAGDPAVNVVSLRDAQDRVSILEYDSTKLQRLLDKASLTGDATLARAIVEAAIDSGDSDTVQAFQAAYPSSAEATARLWNANTRKSATVDVVTAMRLAALKPAALSSLQDYEIAAAAAGQTRS